MLTEHEIKLCMTLTNKTREQVIEDSNKPMSPVAAVLSIIFIVSMAGLLVWGHYTLVELHGTPILKIFVALGVTGILLRGVREIFG